MYLLRISGRCLNPKSQNSWPWDDPTRELILVGWPESVTYKQQISCWQYLRYLSFRKRFWKKICYVPAVELRIKNRFKCLRKVFFCYLSSWDLRHYALSRLTYNITLSEGLSSYKPWSNAHMKKDTQKNHKKPRKGQILSVKASSRCLRCYDVFLIKTRAHSCYCLSNFTSLYGILCMLLITHVKKRLI